MNWIIHLITIALSILAYWHYWKWTHKRMLQLAASIPGPPAIQMLGKLVFSMVRSKEQLSIISDLLRTYGQYVKFWLGPDLNVCVKNPADVRLLLTSNKIDQKGPLYEMMKVFIGPGVLTGGPTWRYHRKIATPSFNKKSVQFYATVFNREAIELAKLLSKRDPNISFNIYYDVVHTTTQSVCQTLMGLSKHDTYCLRRLDDVVRMTPRMYDQIFMTMTLWWQRLPIIRWLTGIKKKEDYYVRIIDELATDIISKIRRQLEKSQVNEEPMGVVERYIKCGELNEQELKWETFSLFTTSQEAAAKIASGLLLFLAHLPDWQEKVYNEIIEVLGPEDNEVSSEDLKKLHNLDMVLKEVLRNLSIAALIQRTVEEDITIKNGSLTLPKGTSVLIPIHDINHDPQFWDEPTKVKPERFLPENVKKRDPNVFIPFSLGAMDCIGRVYATGLIKTIAVRVLRQMILVGDGGSLDNMKLHVAISVGYADGYNVRVRPRKSIGKTTFYKKV